MEQSLMLPTVMLSSQPLGLPWLQFWGAVEGGVFQKWFLSLLPPWLCAATPTLSLFASWASGEAQLSSVEI